MKKLKQLKELTNLTEEYQKELESIIKKIKKKFQKKILKERLKLISEISKGEGLDEEKMKEKYLHYDYKINTKEKIVNDQNNNMVDLLSYINIDGEDYYYEEKINGNVYNKKSKKVGINTSIGISFTS